MTSYAIRRILLIVPTVFLALSFLFFLFFTLPGDPANLIAGGGDRTIDPGVIERIEERYGLDDPMPEQFVNYWKRTVQWDLGDSYLNRRSVNEILGEQGGQQPPPRHLGDHHRDHRRHRRRPRLGDPPVLVHRSA